MRDWLMGQNMNSYYAYLKLKINTYIKVWKEKKQLSKFLDHLTYNTKL